MKNIKAIFFDLDGTLINSKIDITASVNDLRRDLKLSDLTEKEVIGNVGRGTKYLLGKILPKNIEINDQIFNTFIEYYKQNSIKYLNFYKGALELLNNLDDYKKVLITNKAYVVTQEIIEKSKLNFDLVYGGDSFDLRKPDPFPLNQAAQELNLEKNEIIYFGDSIFDYQASEAANISCVMASYGYGNPKELYSCKNALFVNTPLELLDIIEDLKE
ncbi:MAG: HAD family hydrolase, partial [Candidatus Sericytochromatia bacterium]|nr:HAD family hydrolase [Candidatus Sericytochromatia bacterium]